MNDVGDEAGEGSASCFLQVALESFVVVGGDACCDDCACGWCAGDHTGGKSPITYKPFLFHKF